jgi:alkanesulfonate monooxygenase SsuD/methylene tetrahydromethanopterin reductase-like flavin-dependent oxidoreductase (luciferase family)
VPESADRRSGLPAEPGVRFGFGLINCQRLSTETRSDVELYAEAIALAQHVEARGFHSVWLTEHHFFDDSYLPAMLPLAAAIGARTSTIRIGTGVLLAPLYHPIRLAEDAATTDLIAGGRLILGLGAGWMEREFETLEIDYEGRHRALGGTIAALRTAWGPYSQSPVTPKPAQRGGPPIWIGAGSETALRRAGRVADGYLGNYYAGPEEFGRKVDIVLEEVDRRGARDAFDVGFQLPVAALPSGAWEAVRESVHHVLYKYDQHDRRTIAADGSILPPPPLDTESERERRSRGLFGTPAEVADGIARYVDAARGRLLFVARMYWPGIDPGLQRELIDVFAAEVMPRFR